MKQICESSGYFFSFITQAKVIVRLEKRLGCRSAGGDDSPAVVLDQALAVGFDEHVGLVGVVVARRLLVLEEGVGDPGLLVVAQVKVAVADHRVVEGQPGVDPFLLEAELRPELLKGSSF